MQHPPSSPIQPSMQNPLQNNPHIISHQHMASQHSSFFNPPSYSQSPNPTLQFPSRLRIHSFQQPRNNCETQQLIQKKQTVNLEKLRGNHSLSKQNGLKQSNGIINQPPNYIPNKYTFKNEYDPQRSLIQSGDCAIFGSCCSIIKQSQREVYLSPTQLITMNYFNPVRQEPKSLKFINNKSNGGSVVEHQPQQRSFFKESSNMIE